jgi:predicted nucleotidyltransferase
MSLEARYTLDDIIGLVTPIINQYSAVNRAFIFGSYAKGEADSRSDLDIRIEADGLRAMDYCGLAGRLMMALDIPMDLIETNNLSEEFLDRIRGQEVLIFER